MQRSVQHQHGHLLSCVEVHICKKKSFHEQAIRWDLNHLSNLGRALQDVGTTIIQISQNDAILSLALYSATYCCTVPKHKEKTFF